MLVSPIKPQMSSILKKRFIFIIIGCKYCVYITIGTYVLEVPINGSLVLLVGEKLSCLHWYRFL